MTKVKVLIFGKVRTKGFDRLGCSKYRVCADEEGEVACPTVAEKVAVTRMASKAASQVAARNAESLRDGVANP